MLSKMRHPSLTLTSFQNEVDYSLLRFQTGRKIKLKMCDHDNSDEDYKHLIDAVKSSNLDCVTALIRKGAGVKIPRKDLKTATAIAIENYQKKLLINDATWKTDFEILVSLFMDGDLFESNSEDQRLMSLCIMNMSAFTGLDRCLQKVIDSGVDPDAPFEGPNAPISGPSRALMVASAHGYIECVNILLKAGANANLETDDLSILMITAGRGWHECIESLLQAGADVNFADSRGFTALNFAVVTDELSTTIATSNSAFSSFTNRYSVNHRGEGLCVKILIDGGADVNVQTVDGTTPLMFAAENKQTACLKYILNAGAQVNDCNHYGETALMMAAEKGNLECLKILIEAGADVNKGPLIKWPGENCCKTALMLAAKGGYHSCVVALLKAEADVNTLENSSKTALMYAAKSGQKDCVATLLQWGAAVNVWDDKHELTALMQAAKNTSGECAGLLVQAGADVNKRDKNGKTALMYAAEAGNHDCVDCLLQKGVYIHEQDYDGMMAIDYAARHGCFQSVEKLLSAGADVDHLLDDNYTTLMYAAMSGNYKCVEAIIEAGADVNIETSNYGYTALCFAAYELKARPEKVSCMELLIQAGADVESGDSIGTSILHFAAISGYLLGIQYLLNKGADVNACDNYGNTALMFAAGSGHDSYVESIMQDVLDISSVQPGQYLPNPGADMVGCVTLLLQSGAHVNKLNNFRENALMFHVANSEPINKEVAMLLFAAGETIDVDTVFRTTRSTTLVPVQVPDYLLEPETEEEELRLSSMSRAAVRNYMLKASPVNLCCRAPQLGLPSMLTDYLLYGASINVNEDRC